MLIEKVDDRRSKKTKFKVVEDTTKTTLNKLVVKLLYPDDIKFEFDMNFTREKISIQRENIIYRCRRYIFIAASRRN